MKNPLLLLFSLSLLCQIMVSCSAEGDIHPELQDIYTTVENDDNFELDYVFNEYLRDIEVLGEFLFVYYPVYAMGTDSSDELVSLHCKILKDGEEHYEYAFEKERIYNPFDIDKAKNVYIGNTVVYAPNYDHHEVLPSIDPLKKEESLALLKSIIAPSEIKFKKEHFDRLDDVTNHRNEDSLINELLYGYENDMNLVDSNYREYLFFFLFNADSYMWSKDYTVVHYNGQAYFWNSYEESGGRYKTFRKKIYTLDKTNSGTFEPSTASIFGKVKFENPSTNVQVIRFDKSIEEWDVHAIGAPHVGLGIIFPDPAKIWYYEVLKQEQSIFKFKVRENDNDNLEPFNYLTSKDEFYLYDLHKGEFLRVRSLEKN